MTHAKSRFTKTMVGFSAALFLATSFLTGCKKDDDNPAPTTGNIVQVAQANPNFSALVAAVVKTDPAGTLSGNTQLTVFAPTNAAFAKLAAPYNTAANIAAITNAGEISTLRGILLYHVAAGKKTAASLTAGPQTTQRPATSGKNDNTVYISKSGSNVSINGVSKVVTADVQASNGVIHAIDNVLLPPDKNIVEIAQGNNAFTALVAAVVKTGLASTLSDANANITVFAPTDAAFAQLPDPYKTAASINAITDQAQIDFLKNVLLYHAVTSGRVFSTDLANGDVTTAASTASNKVTIAVSGTGATVKGKSNATASAISPTLVNILATNGVVHVIDQVLLP